jgi:hypothetical protein
MWIAPPPTGLNTDIDIFRPKRAETAVCINKYGRATTSGNYQMSLNTVNNHYDDAEFETDIYYKAYRNNFIKPTPEVIESASFVRKYLTKVGVKVNSLLPLPEGGVEIEVIDQNSYTNIKFDNEGDGIYYKENSGHTPEGWDLDFEATISKVMADFHV